MMNYEKKEEISLVSQQLSSLPSQLLNPPISISSYLRVIKLDHNNFSSLPAAFSILTSLEILFAGYNNFTSYPRILMKLPSLRIVSFRNNQIADLYSPIVDVGSDATIDRQAEEEQEQEENDGEEGAVFSTLNSFTLQVLILTNNHITRLPASLSIGKLTKLKKIMLSNNQIKILPIELLLCQELELIRLASNQLEEIPSWLFQLPCLSWLALSGNPCFPTSSMGKHSTSHKLISSSDIEIHDKIGEGASGVIYKATSISSPALPTSQKYAIKFFKEGSTSDGNTEDEQNISLSLPLHPSLVPVLGTIIHPETHLSGLIFPLIPSSYVSLASPPSLVSLTRDVYQSSLSLSLSTTISILIAISSCCSLLHSVGIMHGDLYAHNILISSLLSSSESDEQSQPQPYLVDFGASTRYHSYSPTTNNSAINLLHFELIEVNAFSKLFDELLKHTIWSAEKEKCGMRSELTSLCERCSSRIIETRPRFHEIEKVLNSIFQSLTTRIHE